MGSFTWISERTYLLCDQTQLTWILRVFRIPFLKGMYLLQIIVSILMFQITKWHKKSVYRISWVSSRILCKIFFRTYRIQSRAARFSKQTLSLPWIFKLLSYFNKNNLSKMLKLKCSMMCPWRWSQLQNKTLDRSLSSLKL